MSISVIPRPINPAWHRTTWYLQTRGKGPRIRTAIAVLLPVLAAGATFTIWMRDPLAAYAYEFAIFMLSGVIVLADGLGLGPAASWPLAAISAWGFAQIAGGASVYRWATLQTALRFAALALTAVVASKVFRSPHVRRAFLFGLAWFGFGTAVLSAAAYFTSPGMVLWFAPSPYPDIWGPFLSRNNFAQFLELAMPAALWLGLNSHRNYLLLAATMLAAGFASASRAGAILLVAEAVVAFIVAGRGSGPRAWRFALASLTLMAVAGASTLAARFSDPDPLLYRREIFRSTLAIVAQKPWTGFGLGTFPYVYPEFAVFDTGAVVEHAHNDWLEWAAEGGLPLALIWVVFAARLCRPAIRSIWGMGVVAAFLHALVDYPFARLGTAAWIFLIAGALCAEKNPAEMNVPSSALRKRSVT